MKKSESIDINASADRVWTVAADRFDQIDQWASKVSRSRPLGEPRPADGAVSESPVGRVCTVPEGETIEKLVAYDAQQRTFTYVITGDAMPGFVADARNTWTIKPLSEGRTRLTMSVEMVTRGLMGALMKPMMKIGMGKLLRTNLEELKHFVETGEQHARKKAARA